MLAAVLIPLLAFSGGKSSSAEGTTPTTTAAQSGGTTGGATPATLLSVLAPSQVAKECTPQNTRAPGSIVDVVTPAPDGDRPVVLAADAAVLTVVARGRGRGGYTRTGVARSAGTRRTATRGRRARRSSRALRAGRRYPALNPIRHRGPNSEGTRRVLKGFKDFLMRGNVVDLAVAVVIGTAFRSSSPRSRRSLIEPLINAATWCPAPASGSSWWRAGRHYHRPRGRHHAVINLLIVAATSTS